MVIFVSILQPNTHQGKRWVLILLWWWYIEREASIFWWVLIPLPWYHGKVYIALFFLFFLFFLEGGLEVRVLLNCSFRNQYGKGLKHFQFWVFLFMLQGLFGDFGFPNDQQHVPNSSPASPWEEETVKARDWHVPIQQLLCGGFGQVKKDLLL